MGTPSSAMEAAKGVGEMELLEQGRTPISEDIEAFAGRAPLVQSKMWKRPNWNIIWRVLDLDRGGACSRAL